MEVANNMYIHLPLGGKYAQMMSLHCNKIIRENKSFHTQLHCFIMSSPPINSLKCDCMMIGN